jgi:hypothetical protein
LYNPPDVYESGLTINEVVLKCDEWIGDAILQLPPDSSKGDIVSDGVPFGHHVVFVEDPSEQRIPRCIWRQPVIDRA